MERESSETVQNDKSNILVPTEMGSARWVALKNDNESRYYESMDKEAGFAPIGPPWGLEPSMKCACEQVGIDYQSFVRVLEQNISNEEMATDLDIDEATIKSLKGRFYKMEAINGNTGITGM